MSKVFLVYKIPNYFYRSFTAVNMQQQSQNQQNDDDGNVVRLRGLPWAATAADVLKFFEGTELFFFLFFFL